MNDLANKSDMTRVMFKIETMVEAIKLLRLKMSLNMEIYQQKQQVLQLLDNQRSEIRNRTTCSSIEYSFTRFQLLIETLIEQIKPVNRQKKYISGWTMIINLFWKLRTIRSLNQGLEFFISETNPPHQCKMLDWDLDGKTQTCSYGQTRVRISKYININRTL